MSRSRGAALYPLGVACLATGVRGSLDLGGLMAPWAATVLGAVGALLVLACDGGHDCTGPPRARRAWLAVGALALLAPYALVKWAGAATLAAWSCDSRLPSVAARLRLLAFTIVVVHVALLAADAAALARLSFSALAPAVAGALRILGVPAEPGDGTVSVATAGGFRAFLLQPGSVGLAVQGSLAACVCARAWCEARGSFGARAVGAAGLLACALIVRFLASVAVGVFAEAGQPIDEPGFPLLGVLGFPATAAIDLATAAALAPPWSRFLDGVVSVPLRRRRPLVAALAVLAGCCLAGDRALDCLGLPKAGYVAIDEGHSRWEPTDLRLGPETYGTESGYNFRAWVDWVAQRYGPVRRLYEPFSDELLDGVSVLVIKTPTEPFHDAERAALLRFVERGGGLLLIGDHTNVFGSSEILNRIAARLGFAFEYDCVFDHKRTFEQMFRPARQERADPRLMGVDALRFEVGCSIVVESPRVRPVIVGRGLKSQAIDYTKSNFYPEVVDRPDARCGRFAQMVARSVGRGRVVAFSDSTIFSTFSVCLPGRRELLEATLHWLSFRDIGEGARRCVAGAGWLALLIGAILVRRSSASLACGWALCVAAVAGVAPAGAALLYPAASPIASGAEVVLYEGSARALWPTDGFVRDPSRNFDLFFQWTIRTGRFPRLIRDIDDALRRGAPLVLVDPDFADPATIGRVEAFVRRGNHLLLVETRPSRCVERIARAAGVEVSGELGGGPLRSAWGEIDLPPLPCRRLSGGTPLLWAGDDVLAATASLGEGTVTVVTCGDLFCNARYGGSFHVVPSAALRRLYQVQFDIMAAWTAKKGSAGPPGEQ